MKEQFYDLSIETLDDGTIRLEQRDYSGESVIIDSHPQQLIHIANGLKVCAPEHIQTHPNWEAERIATLERRLLWVRDRFEECHVALPSDMYEQCSEASGFHEWLAASIDVSSEFCADMSSEVRGIPDAPSNALSKPLRNPLKASSLPVGDGCLPNVDGRSSKHQDHRHGDLFPGKALEQQKS